MKNKLLYSIFYIMFLFAMSSCSEGDWDGKGVPSLTGKYLKVSNDQVTIGAEKGSSTSISIECSGTWNVTEVPEWLSVSPTSGSGSSNITLTALTANTSPVNTKSAIITISASGLTKQVTVTQSTVSGAVPTLNIPTVSNITKYSASIAGTFTSSFDITEAGVCYSSTSATPTTESSVIKTDNKGTSGTISVDMQNLKSGTKYYVRTYAVNAKGVSYSEVITFTTNGSIPGSEDNPTPSI